jgi:hypothetical protein
VRGYHSHSQRRDKPKGDVREIADPEPLRKAEQALATFSGDSDRAMRAVAVCAAQNSRRVRVQQRFAEIPLRACQRIGENSRDLEKAQTFRTEGGSEVRLPADGKSKQQALSEAGISTSTAQRLILLSTF